MKLKEVLTGLTSKKGLPKIPKKKPEIVMDYKPFPPEEVSWEDNESLSKYSADQIYCKRMINKYINQLSRWDKGTDNQYTREIKKSIAFWKKMLDKADAEADTSNDNWSRRGAFQFQGA